MMKVSQAVYYHLEYHKANSQQNTQRCVEFVLGKFHDHFQERALASVSHEDVLSFLTKLTFNRRQTTKRNRYSVLLKRIVIQCLVLIGIVHVNFL
jgi:hypothetical protein